MDKDDSRISELKVALDKAERRLADRETLLNAAVQQAETTRVQYNQAHERAESLRQKLTAKEEQIGSLQLQLQRATSDLAKRDEHIAALQGVSPPRAETVDLKRSVMDDDALEGINPESNHEQPSPRSESLAAMGIVLEPLNGLGSTHRIAKTTTTLGRSATNDIRIHSASVSRFHARIVVEPDAIYLIDLQSTNGCTVNDQRVFRQAITDADVIAIGDAKFRVTVDAAAGAEDRSMDETYPLLNDSAILIPTPLAKLSKVKQS